MKTANAIDSCIFKEIAMENPVVFLHGFKDTALFDMVKAIKKAAKETGIDPETIAFASSTVNNMEWKLRKLIHEVTKEHEMVRKKFGVIQKGES
jgi:hypothetical protein